MIFNVERTFLVKTREEVNLEPKDFLHCATIEELTDEVEDAVYNKTEHPTHPGFEISEEIGTRFWDSTYSFYNKWQELKGLPQNL